MAGKAAALGFRIEKRGYLSMKKPGTAQKKKDSKKNAGTYSVADLEGMVQQPLWGWQL
jgi:hypothetical protein